MCNACDTSARHTATAVHISGLRILICVSLCSDEAIVEQGALDSSCVKLSLKQPIAPRAALHANQYQWAPKRIIFATMSFVCALKMFDNLKRCVTKGTWDKVGSLFWRCLMHMYSCKALCSYCTLATAHSQPVWIQARYNLNQIWAGSMEDEGT
jgi:hypothetical protein